MYRLKHSGNCLKNRSSSKREAVRIFSKTSYKERNPFLVVVLVGFHSSPNLDIVLIIPVPHLLLHYAAVMKLITMKVFLKVQKL